MLQDSTRKYYRLPVSTPSVAVIRGCNDIAVDKPHIGDSAPALRVAPAGEYRLPSQEARACRR